MRLAKVFLHQKHKGEFKEGDYVAFMAVLRTGKLQAKDLEPAPENDGGSGMGMGTMSMGSPIGGPMGGMGGPMGPMGDPGCSCGKGGCKGGTNRTQLEVVIPTQLELLVAASRNMPQSVAMLQPRTGRPGPY